MKTLQDYITSDFLDWCFSMSLIYKRVNENLFLLYKSDYCIKIYDRIGHGYNVNINLSQEYSEMIYEGDACSAYWVFRYLGLKENSNFSNRSIDNYLYNLPLLIEDIKILIESMEKSKNGFWDNAINWIDEESKKEFKAMN